MIEAIIETLITMKLSGMAEGVREQAASRSGTIISDSDISGFTAL